MSPTPGTRRSPTARYQARDPCGRREPAQDSAELSALASSSWSGRTGSCAERMRSSRARPGRRAGARSRDEKLKVDIRRVFEANYSVYGASKGWPQLNGEGIVVDRGTVERLTAQIGVQGRVRAWLPTRHRIGDIRSPARARSVAFTGSPRPAGARAPRTWFPRCAVGAITPHR